MTVESHTMRQAADRKQPLALSRGMFDTLVALFEGAGVLLAGWLAAAALQAVGETAPIPAHAPLFIVALAVAYLILGWLAKLHPQRRTPGDAPGLTMPRVLGASFVAFGLAAAALDAAPAGPLAVWLALWFVLALIGVQFVRRAAESIERRTTFRRAPVRRAVLVGGGTSALRLLERLSDEGADIEFAGYFDDRITRVEGLNERLPYLGDLAALIEHVADHEDLHVYMALPWTAGPRIASLLDRLRFLPITVWLVPDPELSALSMSHVEGGDGVVMPTLMTPPLGHWDRLLKGGFDFVAGLAILLLISPILIATAIAIKLDTPGPVLFRQQRSGQFGRKFSIYKFRSLKIENADAEADKLVSAHDDRVTRVGKFSRKYSIDELPQIFNVLKGEMSLVGPRPHAPKAKADVRLYADVVPDYAIRYRVKPGMTGWAQINGWRGETDTEDKLRKRVEFDFQYIREWSFWLDMLILLRTPAAVVLPKNNV
ncbi:MAG: exopolysaccharide biosynthesis polyprenyl glycosylphosphotransferase [Alphaproteobacteria bacterium]|nr:exopolysaccharide biosynthesis polyprenyl glycosylphosphotransferase [Alphaproteobacteria bacterium]